MSEYQMILSLNALFLIFFRAPEIPHISISHQYKRYPPFVCSISGQHNTTQQQPYRGNTGGFDCYDVANVTDCHHGKIDWNPPSLCVVGCLPGYWGGAPSPGCWVGWVGELNLGHWVAQAKITDLSWFRRRRGSYKAHVDQGRNKNQGQAW